MSAEGSSSFVKKLSFTVILFNLFEIVEICVRFSQDYETLQRSDGLVHFLPIIWGVTILVELLMIFAVMKVR
jgi:hypothetical protein